MPAIELLWFLLNRQFAASVFCNPAPELANYDKLPFVCWHNTLLKKLLEEWRTTAWASMTRSSSETRVTSSKSLSVRSDLKADTAFVSKSCHWRWKFSPTLISATINAGVMLKVAQLDHFWLGSSLREYVAQICSEVTLQFFVENWRLWWSVDWLQHFLPRWYKWLFNAARLPSVSQQRQCSVSLLPTLLCVCVRVCYSYNRALIIII